MVRAEFERAQSGEVLAFEVAGHADFAAHGSDVVCAAVSALTFATLNGLTEVVGLRPQVRVDDAAGVVACRLGADALHGEVGLRAQAILETLVLGLQETARSYPGYVEVKEVGRSCFE